MISLSKFRSNLLVIFRVMISTGMYVDVVYKGRLYRVAVEDLGLDVKRNVGGKPRRRSLVDEVKPEKCPKCRKLMIAGVCMNSACPSAASSRS